jgi:predicted O-linked N-acetylglucosamine transferase (SPINDLY family)
LKIPPLKTNASQDLLAQAIAHHEAARLDVAEHLYRAVLAVDDAHAEANHHLGVLEIERGQIDAGLPHLQRALESAPETGHYWQSFADALLLARRYEDALTVIEQALACGLDTPAARDLRARIETDRNAPTRGTDTAAESVGAVDSSEHRTADSATRSSAALKSREQTQRDRLLGLLRTGQLPRAKIVARRLTASDPECALGWKVLGTLLVRDADSLAALPILEKARRLDPDDPETMNSLARAHQALEQADEAVEIYREALALQPNRSEIWNNLGMALQQLGLFEEALISFNKAIQNQQDYTKAHNNCGILLRVIGRPQDALACFEEALKIQPDDTDSLNNLGLALQDLHRFDAALACFDRVLAMKPDHAVAMTNRGNVLKDQGYLDEAMDCYERALEIQPDFIVPRQNHLFCLNYQDQLPREQVFAGHLAFEHYQTAKIAKLDPIAKPDRDPERPLRIGLVSGDFCLHSVAFFLLPVVEHLDRQRFQVFCYMTSHRQDEVTQAFRGFANSWIDAAELGPCALAERIRADSIDLLLDLSGHSNGNALLAFAAKPAPVQITWIGYPNTTGLTAMDYRLVDATTDPVGEADAHHSECLIRLPTGFLCYRPWGAGSALPVGPSPFLESGQITFGSFNNIAKLTPATIDLWASVLRSMPDARLLLKSHSVSDVHVWNRLIAQFTERGVAPHRLEALPRAPSYTDHLMEYRRLDVALDTFPYHGTTTTCEALFMGVPVVTLIGDRHVSRVGASLLNRVGLPELIATSQEDYVRIATGLAADRKRLTALRAGLRERLERSPLRDEMGFTHTLEAVLRQMWRIWCANEAPRVFDLGAPFGSLNSRHGAALPSGDKIAKGIRNKPKNARNESSLAALRQMKKRSHLKGSRKNSPTSAEQATVLALFDQGRYTNAEAAARQLTERYPDAMFGWKALGTILVKANQHQAALPFLLEAIRLSPSDAEAIHNLGFALLSLARIDEAVGCFKRALEISPDYVEAHINLGTAYKDLNRLDEAMEHFGQALELSPDHPEAHCNRGVAFEDLGRLDEAVTDYRRALALQPVYPQAQNNLGNAYKNLGLLDEAVACYRQVLDIQPDLTATFSNLLLCLNYQTDVSQARLFAEHQAFEQRQAAKVLRLPTLATLESDPERVLRIGLVSGDLRLHSVAFFLLPVLEHLNREQFQVFCYSRSHRKDEVTKVFRRLSDGWIDCPGLSQQELAERIRADGIDLLVDLSGHTSPNALLAFAARPAPVQITWLGYPNTTGLTAMDYRLVDAVTDPVGESDAYHSECLIRLPRGFLCYRPWKSGAELPVALPPCLEENRITFGSFNNLAKITPDTLDLWVAVMRVVPDAHLLLKSHTAFDTQVWDRLVTYFAEQGIASERLEILPRAPSYVEHLAQYQRLDIALDTFPYHGTTTTCEALFMGVPVITLMGDRHAARVGASLLTQVGLPELIAKSSREYAEIAKDLASDLERLKELRGGLRERLERSPLRDEAGFSRIMGRALRQMWRIWCAGEPPRVFEVSPEQDIEDQSPQHPVHLSPTSLTSDADPVSTPGAKRKQPRKKKPPKPVIKPESAATQPQGSAVLVKARQARSPTPSEQDAVIGLFNQGRYLEAEAAARRLTENYPEAMFGWKILGTSLVKSNQHEAAFPLLLEANRIAPGDAECINSLGSALQHLGRLEEALACFERAVELRPDYALAHNNQGAVLSDMGRFEAALACYEQALSIAPNSAEVHDNLGLTMHLMGRDEDALACFERVLAIKPETVDALNKRGILLQNFGRFDDALISLDQALAIKPDSADALNNRGNILKDQGYLDEAMDCYRRAVEIQPDLIEPWHNRLLCLNYQADIPREKVFAEHRAFEQYQAAKVFRLPPLATLDRDPERRLRIGLVSGDFRQHSVAFFLLPVMERLDRQRFQVFCYMTSHRRDDVTRTFRALADGWVDSAGLGARALANRIRADGIDLLLDLSGHTEGNFLLAFAAKPAPVQITWIGYPNTTGLTAMDYRLVDAVTDPPGEADADHSECLIRLPSGFLCYRPWDAGLALPVGPLPCLETGGITFGSFNNLAKLTPITLDLWGELLRAMPDARLLLKTPTTAEIQVWDRLVARFARQGIAPERLEALSRTPDYAEHLRLYQRIDIALDPFPYHGTTTTCEALFMGVPVVTLAGDRHVSRVGASLLTRVGLPELIATSPADYARIAGELAADRKRLSELRAGLRERLAQSPLCDEIGFTRILEGALREMWRIWCADESPRVFDVTPSKEAGDDGRRGKEARHHLGKTRPAATPTPTPSEQDAVITLFDQGRLAEAETAARQFTERYPEAMFGWKALGTILGKRHDSQAAEPILRQALQRSPRDVETLDTLGKVLLDLNRLDEAVVCLEQALAIQPEFTPAHNNLGAVLRTQGNLNAAVASYRRALAIRPDDAEAHSNLGTVLKDLGRLDEALACYSRALEIQPGFAAAHSNRLFCLNYQTDISREQVFAEHRAYEHQQAARVERMSLAVPDRDPGRVLRLGLVSGDLRDHSVAFFLRPILERIDRGHFQVFCYSKSHQRDGATESFERLANAWFDASGLSDDALVQRIQSDRIDILLDLSGHTSGNALMAFAAKPAPVQVTWIGYPNTTGLTAMDYRLVDVMTDPAGEADTYHSEHLIRLPTGFLCYRPLAQEGAALSVSSLPSPRKGVVTFGSFNTLAKISPAALDLWAMVLRAVPESRLLLKSSLAVDSSAWATVMAHFETREVDPSRLEILPCAAAHQDHLALYRRLDIALDTFPYHGTTTTCEALFMGVPVVTLAGDRHVSRVGASLLTRVGLPELIATTPADYARIAGELAVDRKRLSELRAGLRERLARSPLCDEVGFTRTLEGALREMWRIWCADEPPHAFDVDAR